MVEWKSDCSHSIGCCQSETCVIVILCVCNNIKLNTKESLIKLLKIAYFGGIHSLEELAYHILVLFCYS